MIFTIDDYRALDEAQRQAIDTWAKKIDETYPDSAWQSIEVDTDGALHVTRLALDPDGQPIIDGDSFTTEVVDLGQVEPPPWPEPTLRGDG